MEAKVESAASTKVEEVKRTETITLVDDSKLRRVSLSTNALLFALNPTSGTFDTNEKVMELLHAMRNKYRLFLITQVASEGSPDHEVAKAQLQ